MGGWEDYSKNKTNLSLRLVEVEAELGNRRFKPVLIKHGEILKLRPKKWFREGSKKKNYESFDICQTRSTLRT